METRVRTTPVIRRHDAAPAASRTAEEIIKALALPAAGPAASAPQPLPLSRLPQLPRETSMLYQICHIDSSGRIASRTVIDALHWQPGDRLDMAFTPNAVVIRPATGGVLHVLPRRCVVIPASARRFLDVGPADQVLLAATPEYQVLIVHSIHAMDDMLAAFYRETAGRGAGTGG
jgi:hypothetical protein